MGRTDAGSSAPTASAAIANEPPMTPELALRLGRAVTFVAGRGKTPRPAHPHRQGHALSGYMLETAMAAGHLLDGRRRDALRPHPHAGRRPPHGRACARTRASSSAPATTRTTTTASRSSAATASSCPTRRRPRSSGSWRTTQACWGRARPAPTIGRAEQLEDSRGRYVVFAKTTFPRDLSLDGIRVVVDAAHGAAYRVAPLVFEELGAGVTAIGVTPNGVNINRGRAARCTPRTRARR